jgi:hypothetical protein
LAKDYHQIREESTGFMQIGGIGTPGLLEIYDVWIVYDARKWLFIGDVGL